ncbi:iron-siderophore ABC transporter substrate-binding protein [Fodinicola feengrottensis]|uniref:Iron-siderophore ABC transporter substrate-binding protein n=1 Tax=Fodinicola feengrottensis TaxID=435914 RepID=A0ABN2G3Y4_9ACTN
MAVSRRAVLAGLAGAGLVGVSACAGGTAATDSAGGGVTLKHKFGTSVVAKRPLRVVSMGTTDHDVALALGVVPVALSNFVGTPTGVGPWATRQLGKAKPQLFVGGGEISVETVAKLAPDLILAVQSNLTKDRYDKLSQLAPVVAPPAGYIDWGVPWQQQARSIGAALWQRQAAEKLVTAAEAQFAAARKAHPAFNGKTVVVASVFSGAAGTYNAYTRQDARMQFMAGLGLKPAPKVDALGVSKFTVPISREKVDLLESDLVVIVAFDDAAGKAVDADQLFNGLNVARRKAVIRLSLKDEGLALSCDTILSIPYGLTAILPKMAGVLRTV